MTHRSHAWVLFYSHYYYEGELQMKKTYTQSASEVLSELGVGMEGLSTS